VSTTLGIVVAAVTVVNILACLWLLFALRKKPAEKVQVSAAETTGHVWDEDLREYNNPLPRWWLWLFVITVVFGIAYIVLYPGLGNFAGTLGWSQQEEHDAQAAANEARLQRSLAPFAAQPIAALAQDPAALGVGRNLFANNCATCHGSDARGAPGFPNLVDSDWLWGNAPETIQETIANGRNGVMTPWGPVLGAGGVEDVLAYTLSLSGRSVPAGDTKRGKAQYDLFCVACHGTDGRGIRELGAPNLTDNVWLHGGSLNAIRQTIQLGRVNAMPAHLDRLGELRVRLLTAYVLSLGEVPRSAQRQAAIDAYPQRR
jgi:cytochrome c oxidase cbb3-type subunit 3